MKTYVERKLMEMRKIAPMLSVDIFYDNYGESRNKQFVVKIHDPFGVNEHFRSNHVRKSLRMALKWIKSL